MFYYTWNTLLPFTVNFRSDQPAYEQVVFAAKKAVAAGALHPGDRFPSVRALSQELRINPNTAHKVVAQLTAEGLLQVQPGIGTIVQHAPKATAADRRRWLEVEIDRLVVEARHRGLNETQILDAIRRRHAKDI
ncbi:MAG: GntR family transcriptional regulator [Synoicihabitans sp.]